MADQRSLTVMSTIISKVAAEGGGQNEVEEEVQEGHSLEPASEVLTVMDVQMRRFLEEVAVQPLALASRWGHRSAEEVVAADPNAAEVAERGLQAEGGEGRYFA